MMITTRVVSSRGARLISTLVETHTAVYGGQATRLSSACSVGCLCVSALLGSALLSVCLFF